MIPKTAVGTTDFADKDGTAVQGVFTRRVAAKEVLDHDEALSHPCHPYYEPSKLAQLAQILGPYVTHVAHVTYLTPLVAAPPRCVIRGF
jgi:hypothetical protein